MARFYATQPLFWNADRSQVVTIEDVTQAFVLRSKGGEVPREVVEAHDLLDRGLVVSDDPHAVGKAEAEEVVVGSEGDEVELKPKRGKNKMIDTEGDA